MGNNAGFSNADCATQMYYAGTIVGINVGSVHGIYGAIRDVHMSGFRTDLSSYHKVVVMHT